MKTITMLLLVATPLAAHAATNDGASDGVGFLIIGIGLAYTSCRASSRWHAARLTARAA